MRMLAAWAAATVGLGLLAGCTSSTASGGAAPATGSAAPSTSVEPVEPVEPAATDAPRPAATDVVLTAVTWDAVDGVAGGGYVSPVVEEGGTCTLRLQQGDRVVSASSAGVPDATTTVCAGLRIAAGAVTAGRWTAVLDYRSTAASGSSTPLELEVPR